METCCNKVNIQITQWDDFNQIHRFDFLLWLHRLEKTALGIVRDWCSAGIQPTSTTSTTTYVLMIYGRKHKKL